MGARNLIEMLKLDGKFFNVSVNCLNDIPALIDAAKAYGQFSTAESYQDIYNDLTTFRDGEFDLEISVYAGDAETTEM